MSQDLCDLLCDVADEHLYDDGFGYHVTDVTLIPQHNMLQFEGRSIRATLGGHHATLRLEIRLEDFMRWADDYLPADEMERMLRHLHKAGLELKK